MALKLGCVGRSEWEKTLHAVEDGTSETVVEEVDVLELLVGQEEVDDARNIIHSQVVVVRDRVSHLGVGKVFWNIVCQYVEAPVNEARHSPADELVPSATFLGGKIVIPHGEEAAMLAGVGGLEDTATHE